MGGPRDDVVLERPVDAREEHAEACDAHEEAAVVVGVLLGVSQYVGAYDAELEAYRAFASEVREGLSMESIIARALQFSTVDDLYRQGYDELDRLSR